MSQLVNAGILSEKIILAGGCFWGMEEILRTQKGVLSTKVGYTGGTTPNPTYLQVSTGTTGHAEAIEVSFNPQIIKLSAILDLFFRMHDPTTKNRQGNDIGTQYRSAIFYLTEEQRSEAQKAKDRAEKSGRWKNTIVTEIIAASEFTSAENYHQEYLKKNPGGYTCHFVRD